MFDKNHTRKFLFALSVIWAILLIALLILGNLGGKLLYTPAHAKPAIAQFAPFPFEDSFESDSLNSAYWSQSTTDKGVVKISTVNPHAGSNHVFIGQNLQGAATAELLLNIDLAGQSEVYLDFWWRVVDATPISAEAGVYISDDKGTTWLRILDFVESPITYRHEFIDLMRVAADNNLALNNRFSIRFYYGWTNYGGGKAGAGYRIDDIRLTTRTQEVAAFPFQENFENDVFNQGWFPLPIQNGVVEIRSDEAHSGAKHLFLGQKADGAANADLLLLVDLDKQTDVYLDFWWRKIGNAAVDQNSGVYISNDDGANWVTLSTFTDNPITYRHDVLNVTKAAEAKGLTPLNNHIWIAFVYKWTNYGGGVAGTGFRIDDIRLTTRSQEVATFSFQEDFETDTLSQGWFSPVSNNGVVSIRTDEPYAGSKYLFLGQNADGAASANLWLLIDIDKQTDVYLDFWWRKVGTSPISGDSGIYISNDEGDNWTNIWKFSGDPTTYRNDSIDLKAITDAKGIGLSKQFLIRFSYEWTNYGGGIAGTGYRIDNVQIAPKAALDLPFPTRIATLSMTPTPVNTAIPSPTAAETSPTQTVEDSKAPISTNTITFIETSLPKDVDNIPSSTNNLTKTPVLSSTYVVAKSSGVTTTAATPLPTISTNLGIATETPLSTAIYTPVLQGTRIWIWLATVGAIGLIWFVLAAVIPARRRSPTNSDTKDPQSKTEQTGNPQTAAPSKVIKILFLAANPSETTRLRIDEETRAIDVALRESKYRDMFELEKHTAVRVSDLSRLLLRYQPDIIHFSGHGSSSNEIILEDASGKSHPVSQQALSRLFATLPDNIKCVVLNACYSMPQAEAIAEHIDCVIGMSTAIGDESAISFAANFYQALGYGRDMETAFELGRVQIDLKNLGEQDTPILRMNRNDQKKIFLIGEQ